MSMLKLWWEMRNEGLPPRACDIAWPTYVRTEGVGPLYTTPHGAWVVFSRFPLEGIPEYGKKVFVFLAGPTPEEFRGVTVPQFPECVAQARYWRRQLVDLIAREPRLGPDFVFVIPEPHLGDWSSCVDPRVRPEDASMHQLAWEHVMMEQADKSGGVIGFFCWFRWTLAVAAGTKEVAMVPANCGPTTRCEVGFALGKYRNVVL